MESGQQIGRETFGLFLLLTGVGVAVMGIAVHLIVMDLGGVLFMPIIVPAIGGLFGILVMKGVILKQLKTNAEIAAERNKRD
ncbi:MAG: hypothetical protein LBV13_05620 [Methanomassiliicoccaceae archaeon]|jgi:hypothetical protein|nr:hypothetical protein [Methanomassiliicoccaceae archaeon]